MPVYDTATYLVKAFYFCALCRIESDDFVQVADLDPISISNHSAVEYYVLN